MSIDVMSAVWDRYPGSGGELLVALALADNASKDGRSIFPSVEDLARRSKLEPRSVQRHLGHMVAMGWLQVVKVSTGRRGETNHYRICPQWLAGGECVAPVVLPVRATRRKPQQHNLLTGDKLSPVQDGGEPVDKLPETASTGDKLSPVRVTKTASTGDAHVTQSIINRQNTNTPLPPKRGEAGGQVNPTTEQPTAEPPGFAAFRAAFPRWRSGGLALREWNSLSPSPGIQSLILAALVVQAQCDEWQRERGRYIPKPSVWLSRKCWDDEVDVKGVPRVVSAPLPPPVILTAEQRAANKMRAGALAAATRAAMAQRAVQSAMGSGVAA